MTEETIKEYYTQITDAWKTLKKQLEEFPEDPAQKEAYIREANKKITATASKTNKPYGNMICLINQAEMIRVGYKGAQVRVIIEFPDGTEKELQVMNNA